MPTKGVGYARLADATIENCEIRRMKNTVAQPRDGREHHQHRVTGTRCQAKRRQSQQRHAAKQDLQRAIAINQKSREKLPDAGNDEKHRHQKTQLGVAQSERILNPWKQRRENEMEEM